MNSKNVSQNTKFFLITKISRFEIGKSSLSREDLGGLRFFI